MVSTFHILNVLYIFKNVDNSTGEIKGTKKKTSGTNVAIDDNPES